MAKNVDDALFASGKKFSYVGDRPTTEAEYDAANIQWGDGMKHLVQQMFKLKLLNLKI